MGDKETSLSLKNPINRTAMTALPDFGHWPWPTPLTPRARSIVIQSQERIAKQVTSAQAFNMFAFPARNPRGDFKKAISRTILRNAAISAIASCKVKHASASRWRSSHEHKAHLQTLEDTFLALRVDYSELNLRRLKANGS